MTSLEMDAEGKKNKKAFEERENIQKRAVSAELQGKKRGKRTRTQRFKSTREKSFDLAIG